MTEKTFKIPLYGGKFKLIFTDDLSKVESEHCLIHSEDTNALVFQIGGSYYAAFETKEITPGIIAHEAKHIVNYVFKDICAKLDPDNDEPECYFLKWIVDKIHENLPKK